MCQEFFRILMSENTKCCIAPSNPQSKFNLLNDSKREYEYEYEYEYEHKMKAS